MKRVAFALLFSIPIAFAAPPAEAQGPSRSWHFLTTGNGHGFQVFERNQNRITYFLEHPYRYVAPADDGRTGGIGRRDLAHDIYFGVRVNGSTRWLHDAYTNIEYEEQTHIIRANTDHAGAAVDTYYFAPFGYAGNGMVMLIRVRNNGSSAMNVSMFAKPNLKLGNSGDSRVEPGDGGEQISWAATPIEHAIETGPGGGHAIYVPIGGFAQAACGTDAALYNAVRDGNAIGSNRACNGSQQVMVVQQDAQIAPGSSAWWGLAVLFVNDNPNHGRASMFRDSRSVSDIVQLWRNFAGNDGAETLHTKALEEFEGWRAKNIMPSQLNATERILWRQSESIQRMGQVRERAQKNDGMMLAALPVGEWHTGWVRDAMYAVVANAMTGHVDEARRAIEFFIGAEAGFFKGNEYIGFDYRVSGCRYFGNGFEEGDFNQDGPNIQTDGWGLTLWAARSYLHYSCGRARPGDTNFAWLDSPTWRGDTVYEGLKKVAEDIERRVDSGGLPGPDASIWEVHWQKRKVFGYTAAAQIRGLYDFADIARAKGDTPTADRFKALADKMLAAARSGLVYRGSAEPYFVSHADVAGNPINVDGSAVAFLDFGLVNTSDPLFEGTLNAFSKLVTGFGGYRRLEEQLSLTGERSANAYDLSEWILLDLRIGDAWRRVGFERQKPQHVTFGDQLLNKITTHAAVNDFLVPELFDKDNGSYTGVVPMVGYGAGAWMMSQLRKYGARVEPAPNTNFDHCNEIVDPCDPNPCKNNPDDPNRGVCVANGQAVTCECNGGYHLEGDRCVKDVQCIRAEDDPTGAGGTCRGHGVCTDDPDLGPTCECEDLHKGFCGECVDNAAPDASGACVCNRGYIKDGKTCKVDTSCGSNPCGDHGTCDDSSGAIVCACAEGYAGQNPGSYCTECVPGFRKEGNECKRAVVSESPDGSGGETATGSNFDDGPASLCLALSSNRGLDGVIYLFMLISFAAIVRTARKVRRD